MYTICGTWGSAGKRSTECVGWGGGEGSDAGGRLAAAWLGGLAACWDDLKVGRSAGEALGPGCHLSGACGACSRQPGQYLNLACHLTALCLLSNPACQAAD